MAKRDHIANPYAYVVGASMYGGPSDPSSGHTGYKGDSLDGKMAYAELNMGTALGSLPYKTPLEITYNGRTVYAIKLDIGLGGAPVKGHARRIDLWHETAQAIGFSGIGLVTIRRADGKPIQGPHDQTADPGKIEVPSTFDQIIGAAKDTGSTIGNLAGDAVKGPMAVGDFLSHISDPGFWLRVGKIIAGAVAILLGVYLLAKEFGIPTPKAIPVPV